MEDAKVREVYAEIKKCYDKHLKDKGVVLPSLERGGQFTKDALVLAYLCQGYPNTKIVTKNELTRFIQNYYSDVADVQQARHLAAQKGWYILSGTRGDNNSQGLKSGEYKLISLEECYPGFSKERRVFKEGDDFFEDLKKAYDYRCATCGSKEGEPHRYWTKTTTILQKGHMNPSKPLEAGNIIPQCDKCNRPDRNYWVYDEKGRVIAVANEKVIDKCSVELQRKIYERLKNKFDKAE